jgi:hypothetical protein
MFISDLAGMDIHAHDGQPERAIAETRNWLANVSRRKLPSGQRLIMTYERFLAELPALAEILGFEADQIPYVDYESMVVGWLLKALPADDQPA